MRRLILLSLPILLLAGCGETSTVAPRAIATVSPPMRPTGLERVLGQDAAVLTALFGDPAQDTREEGARRLQFSGPICVLDAYLYPGASAREAVTYVDARQLNGADIDRASCVASLAHRRQGASD